MHFKYVILLSVLVSYIMGSNALAQPDVGQFIKSIENKGDINSASALVSKIQALPANKAAEDTAKIKPIDFPLQKNIEGNIANDKGVDVGKLLGKYQPQFKAEMDKPRKLNQLIIFISLSMPSQSLVALNAQAKKAGGLLVIRGLVNNSFKETANVLQGLSAKGVDVIVDPRLFEAFAVTSVPTFVVTPTDSHPCGDKKCSYTPIHDRISGNVSLEYALWEIARGGEVSNEVAKNYLTKLRASND